MSEAFIEVTDDEDGETMLLPVGGMFVAKEEYDEGYRVRILYAFSRPHQAPMYVRETYEHVKSCLNVLVSPQSPAAQSGAPYPGLDQTKTVLARADFLLGPTDDVIPGEPVLPGTTPEHP